VRRRSRRPKGEGYSRWLSCSRRRHHVLNKPKGRGCTPRPGPRPARGEWLIAHCGSSLSGNRRVRRPGHRDPDRQGHHRDDGGRQERPCAWRRGPRNSPITAAPDRAARTIWPSPGDAEAAIGPRRRADRPPSLGAEKMAVRQSGRDGDAMGDLQVCRARRQAESQHCWACGSRTGRHPQIRVHLAHIDHRS